VPPFCSLEKLRMTLNYRTEHVDNIIVAGVEMVNQQQQQQQQQGS
jgi:hypothetical protein